MDGRRLVVTGGASGIGRAIGAALHDSGARVVILDLHSGSAEEAARALGNGALGNGAQGAGAVGIGCDVSDGESVATAFAGLTAEGKIDALVNCAGVSHVGSLLTTSEADFDRLFAVNVRGTYLCMKAAVAHMKKEGGGTILNMASIAATAGLADRFAYSMTKGAVLSMTLSAARDYVADGIRVNCLSPARVHTPFVDDFVTKNYPGREQEMYEKLAKSQPIGRMGTAEEIASLALYLCSDDASFVTGSNFPIDGGFLTVR
jgi:2-keto-3-deoxy-L-fuconate dehydrogenase